MPKVQTAARIEEHSFDQLVALARQPGRMPRGQLYNEFADFSVTNNDQLSDEQRSLVRQILTILTQQVEVSVRRALALRLAENPDAPHDLIIMLANDQVPVAEPVILRSPVLDDGDLVLIIRHATPAHTSVVARRPGLSARVSEAIVEQAHDGCIIQLLANQSATIPAEALRTLVTRAQANLALHNPLAHRRDLPEDIVARLYEMVASTLQAHIRSNYALDRETLERACRGAQNDAPTAPTDPRLAARQIVDKLAQGGRLGPAFLVKTATQSQRDLFVAAFARMLEAPEDTAEVLARKADPRVFAMALRAIGVERSVFSTVLYGLRGVGEASLTAEERAAVSQVFDKLMPNVARERLEKLIA